MHGRYCTQQVRGIAGERIGASVERYSATIGRDFRLRTKNEVL
jgi:hypothetical protein